MFARIFLTRFHPFRIFPLDSDELPTLSLALSGFSPPAHKASHRLIGCTNANSAVKHLNHTSPLTKSLSKLNSSAIRNAKRRTPVISVNGMVRRNSFVQRTKAASAIKRFAKSPPVPRARRNHIMGTIPFRDWNDSTGEAPGCSETGRRFAHSSLTINPLGILHPLHGCTIFRMHYCYSVRG